MSGCEVEDDAMIRLRQECGAGRPGGEHARPALDAEFALEAAVASHKATTDSER
jgi:hypothetical protein